METATATQSVTVNNGFNTYNIVDAINEAFAKGEKVTANGHEVTGYGKPASGWGTGSVSVRVKGKNPGRPNTIYIKVGQQVRVSF